MDGLLVWIYRDASGSDCTNGGVSSRVEKAILTWGERTPRIFPARPDCPELVLTKGPHDTLRAVPRDLDESNAWVMFGGNFVYSSDARFPSDAPIKVFDRVEA